MPVRSRPLAAFLPLAAVSLLAAAPQPAAPGPLRAFGATLDTVDAPSRSASASADDSLGVLDLLDVSTSMVADLSADGRWLALILSSRRDALGGDFGRDGDPTYMRTTPAQLLVVDTKSLAQRPVFRTRTAVREVSWSPDGTRLALFVVDTGGQRLTLWDRASGKVTTARMPAGQYVAENSELRWSDDGRTIAFAARAVEWRARAKRQFDSLTTAPVVVLDGSDAFLEWDAMNRLSAERRIASWNVATGAVTTLRDEGRIGQWTLAADGSAISVQEDITKKTDYDVIRGREFRLVSQSIGGGASRTIVPSLRNTQLLWAEDGRRFVLSREGRVFLGTIADTTRRQLLGSTAPARPAAADAAPDADTSAAARAQRAKERFSAVRWSPSGDAIVASNSEGLWLVDVQGGGKEMIVALPESTSMAPRPQLVEWSDDGRYLYFAENSRTEWDRAITRYDRQAKEKRELLRGVRSVSGLRLSKDGSTAVFGVTEGSRPPDIHVADASLSGLRRVVETNPQLASKATAGTELLSYLDADGKTRYGVLHYPSDYLKGTRYPTVFIVYESFFDDTWDAVANLLASHGYAVVKPSVGFEIGYPGEAWVKGVTAAANEVIRMGVADSARLGVHGTSYGGYATNLLITQTDRFKAAINMSGKVDVISFYTDSPRLGVRNIHAAEKSQDRIGATLWQQPQKYVQHSAVMFADRIKTPLLLMTGGEDHNVPALNTREMYYALRRLGKPVVWANYTYGGHGTPMTTVSDFVDYHQRILDWYGRYLMPKKGTNVSDGAARD